MKRIYFFIFSFFIIAIVGTIGIHTLNLNKVTGNSITPISFNETKALSEITNYKSDLRQIHCYCGCDHTDLYNCYEEDMLTNCGTCMNEYKDYLSLKDNYTISEISSIIDEKYKDTVPDDDD